MTQASDDYELFTQRVMQELSRGGLNLRHKHPYTGKVSGRTIVVDVSFEFTFVGGARILVLVECKHYSNTVEVGDVEEFHSKLDDIGAHKGIVVTTKGYQSGARDVAAGREIALALLTTEMQPNEIRYIYAAAAEEHDQEPVLQGNLQCIIDNHDGGYRFNDAKRLINLMYEDLEPETESGTEQTVERERRAASNLK